jgi:hypothetical protein
MAVVDVDDIYRRHDRLAGKCGETQKKRQQGERKALVKDGGREKCRKGKDNENEKPRMFMR